MLAGMDRVTRRKLTILQATHKWRSSKKQSSGCSAAKIKAGIVAALQLQSPMGYAEAARLEAKLAKFRLDSKERTARCRLRKKRKKDRELQRRMEVQKQFACPRPGAPEESGPSTRRVRHRRQCPAVPRLSTLQSDALPADLLQCLVAATQKVVRNTLTQPDATSMIAPLGNKPVPDVQLSQPLKKFYALPTEESERTRTRPVLRLCGRCAAKGVGAPERCRVHVGGCVGSQAGKECRHYDRRTWRCHCGSSSEVRACYETGTGRSSVNRDAWRFEVQAFPPVLEKVASHLETTLNLPSRLLNTATLVLYTGADFCVSCLSSKNREKKTGWCDSLSAGSLTSCPLQHVCVSLNPSHLFILLSLFTVTFFSHL
jgi:hypothetical protein